MILVAVVVINNWQSYIFNVNILYLIYIYIINKFNSVTDFEKFQISNF
jgi:hypothetical protein